MDGDERSPDEESSGSEGDAISRGTSLSSKGDATATNTSNKQMRLDTKSKPSKFISATYRTLTDGHC
jgi:hypothetical protein